MATFIHTWPREQFATVLLTAIVGLITSCESDQPQPASPASLEAVGVDSDVTVTGQDENDVGSGVAINGDAEAACPVAVISVLDSDPQASNWLRLDGSLSYSSYGPIVAFEWTSVGQDEQPAGVFSPSEASASSILKLPAGIYQIRLNVRDSRGVSSCNSEHATITVRP